MFKYILALSLVFIFATEAEAQVITQSWIDPCNGEAQTATLVIGMGAVTIMYRGQGRAFTKQDFIDGTLMSWVMETTATIPCPVNQVVVATVNAAAQAAAQAAAAAAARAAAQAAAEAAAAAAAAARGMPPARDQDASQRLICRASRSGGFRPTSGAEPARARES